MEVLTVLLVVFILLFMFSKSSKATPTASCKTHKWIWEKQPGDEEIEYLRCSVCKKTPTEVANG